MDEENRLSNPKLFAKWAREDFPSWQQLTGVSVTHLSRGDGQVTDVSREAGSVSIQVQYAHAARSHALWEFRTEITDMTLPHGLTHGDLIAPVKAQRLLQEQARKTSSTAASSKGGR